MTMTTTAGEILQRAQYPTWECECGQRAEFWLLAGRHSVTACGPHVGAASRRICHRGADTVMVGLLREPAQP